MNKSERNEIIAKFRNWFRDTLIVNHEKNTEKLADINEFNINPFLLYYLAGFLEGNTLPETLAKVLVYPRVLGTSITTSFGTGMQSFVTNVLEAYGSTTKGIDIEFVDQVDGNKKYCQLKSGPNAINRDDVKTVSDHFAAIKNLARTNNLRVGINDLVFCLIYGEDSEKNSFVRELEDEYPVYVGKTFWHRFTGDEDFYKELILAAGEEAKGVNMKHLVDSVISDLSKKVEERFKGLA